MTLAQLQYEVLGNLGFADDLAELTLDNLSLAAKGQLELKIEPLAERIKPLINRALEQMARTFFPLRFNEQVQLDAACRFLLSSLEHPVHRVDSVLCGSNPVIYFAHTTEIEVFCAPFATVDVRYSALPAPLAAAGDNAMQNPLAPAGLCATLATSFACAQEGQRAAAAYWDAKYKDETAQILRSRSVMMPRRIWR